MFLFITFNFLIRTVEMKIEHKYSNYVLINEMINITGTYPDENYYMLDHYNDIVGNLGNAVGFDFTFMSRRNLGSYYFI